MVSGIKLYIVIAVFILGVITYYARGQTYNEVKNLYDDLFTGYRKNIIPISDHSQPIEIGFTFFLLSVTAFREVEETIVLTGGLFLNWTDVSLSWIPSSYGNKTYLEVDSTDIWYPWIYLINNAKKLEPVGSDDLFRSFILSSGQVNFGPGQVFEAKCQTDISKFPLDTQKCTLEFHSWSAGADVYEYSSLLDEISLQYYTESSNWKILKTKAYAELHDSGYYKFLVEIEMKREPLYYIVMIILPTLLLCLLNPLVFLLPVESGERMSLAMTILLSYAIFLTLVSASIPSSSNPMCFLLIDMIMIMISSGISVICVIITNKFYYDQTYTPGKFGTCLIHIFRRKKFITPKDHKENEPASLSGIDMSKCLDKIFVVASYILLIIFLLIYFIAIGT